MMKALVKLVVWFAVGCGIVGFTANIADIRAASPWAYTFHSTAAGVGSVTVTGPEKDGEPTTPVKLETGETPAVIKMERRLDAGVVTFLVALYGGGTIMGLLLKRRKKGGWVVADQG